MRRRSLFFPLLLIATGLVIILVNIGVIHGSVWSVLKTYWPVILIIGGLDGLFRRDGWIGPLVFLALGAVLLAGNLGYLNQNAWQLLVRLWPVLLVGWGLDLAFGRGQSTWTILGRVALTLLLVAAIFWLIVAAPGGTTYANSKIDQPLDGETSVELQLSMLAGKFDLSGGADAATLITGTVSMPLNSTTSPNYHLGPGGKGTFRLESTSADFPFENGQGVWDLKVSSVKPLEINSQLGAGEMNLDLQETHLQTIQSQLGVGKMTVNLPSQVSITGGLENAVGEIDLGIPRCADVTLQVDRGITNVTIPADYQQNGNTIRYPAPAGCSTHRIDLNVNLAIGSLQITKLP